ncbi:hypothetical protein TWF694_010254 [Orbilia ellipsospora]|uniref:WD40 repeat-like protein n=1 Tax=Orbilia ellipsospora TaxID=2528407 RepID=A0AAV9XAH9_9PEZI
MKSRSYVGPVTSLAFLGDDLFVGHGSDLKLFSPSSSGFSLRWRKRAFKRERIQGIQFQAAKKGTSDDTRILLWGGKKFQLFSPPGPSQSSFDLDPEDEIPAPDWILNSVFLEPEDEFPKIAIITAHNTILTYTHNVAAPVAQRFKFYPSPERCLLYSANIINNTTVSNTGDLIALAGTVFGEVLLWKLNTLDDEVPARVNLRGRYLSHEGSVFGVSMSPDLRYAASCSDDRTIRLWDTEIHTKNGQSEECVEVKEPLAVGWGHQARIWGVRFLQSSENEIRLLSFSEDLTAKTWSFSTNSTKRSLICTQTFKSLHSASGKNLWSLAIHPSERIFVTGGADSGIASWNLVDSDTDTRSNWAPYCNSKPKIQETIVNLDEILPPTNLPPGKKATKDEPRKYVTLGSRAFIVAMSSGWLLHCDLSDPNKQTWQKLGFWSQIKNTSALGAAKLQFEGGFIYTIALGDNDGRLLFLRANSEGLVTPPESTNEWVSICGSRPSDILFSQCDNCHEVTGPSSVYAAVTTFKPDEPIKLLQISGINIEKTWSLAPPDTFPFTAIMFYRTGGRDLLVAGSRHGAFAVYEIPEDTEETLLPIKVWRHIHDDESVTALDFISARLSKYTEDNAIEVEMVSTGRSGAYKFHKLCIGSELDLFDLKETNSLYPAAVPRVEKYQVISDKTSNRKYEMIHGFRGRDFVLWNQSLGIEAASYDCEGGNRSWDFSFGNDKTATDEGLFVFTKAKKCHIVRFLNILHDPLLQAPFHGRELKTLATSPKSAFPHQIIATGAEDTIIRFSYVHPKTNELVNLTSRKTHTTGLQDLVWSSCGGWLFSSGSIEEVYCWKINRIPSDLDNDDLNIGVLREAIYDVSTDNLPDLRVCGLDVITVHNADGEPLGFLVGMVRSDSSIKLALYQISTKKFVTIAEGFYKTSCLLQIRFHLTADNNILMFTAGTDGFVTIWDITNTLVNCGIVANSKALSAPNAALQNLTPQKLHQNQWILCHGIHRNSIKCLKIVEIGTHEIILLTGGDDTAICISRVQLAANNEKGSSDAASITSKSIERAHASAVTTIEVVSVADQKIDFLSSGIDQQVKRWSLDLSSFTEPDVRLLEDVYVGIPDVAGLAFIQGEEKGGTKLIVGGVGIEILDL